MTRRGPLAALALTLTLAFAPLPARAADQALPAAQLQLATSVVQALGMQHVADALVSALKIVLVQSIAANNKQTPAQVMPAVEQILVPDLKAREPDYIAAVAAIYGRAFTESELQQILAFYQTPTGQKLQSLDAGLTHAMVQAGHDWIGQAGEAVLAADAPRLAAKGLKIN